MVQPPSSPRPEALALRSIHRGKVVALSAVAVLAGTAAVLHMTRPRGRGNPEDPAKVLVVTKERPVGTAAVLRDAGFSADEHTRAALLRKAESELDPVPASETEALLALADLYGYGHVVFVDSAAGTFDGVDTEPEDLDWEDAAFAVVSAGDLAFPHHVTIAGPPPAYLADRFAPLLEAMFEQPALAPVRASDPATIELVRLRDRLAGGLDDLARFAAARERVARVERRYEALVAGEGPEGVQAVAGPYVAGRSVVLPDGSWLVLGRSFHFQTPDAVTVRADLDDTLSVLHLTQPGGRAVKCPEVAGGTVPAAMRPRLLPADDGGSFLLTRLDAPPTLYRFDPAMGACPTREVGPLPPPRPHMRFDAAVPFAGLVAVPGLYGAFAAVAVLDVASGQTDTLGMVPGYDLGPVRFLDERFLVAVLRPRSSELEPVDRIAVLDRDDPRFVYDLDPRVLDGLTRVLDVRVAPAAMPAEAGRVDLLVVGDGVPSPVFAVAGLRRELARRVAQRLRRPPPRNLVPETVALDGASLDVRALPVQGFVTHAHVAASGDHAAMRVEDATGSRAAVLAVARLAPGGGAPPAALSVPEAAGVHGVWVSPDGRRVTFDARVAVPGAVGTRVLLPLTAQVP